MPIPPHDLIVARLEKCPFISGDGSVQLPARASNAHYHLKFECLILADPMFNPSLIVTPDEVKMKLRMEHKEYLQINFGLVI